MTPSSFVSIGWLQRRERLKRAGTPAPSQQPRMNQES